ncbi:MAG: hypothetical protein J6X54_02550, partial [Treponema sp.]|nr:hypothetical protein [Treponema sp.]
MLAKILSKSDCAACKFCCSFRRQSLWETPVFNKEDKDKILEKYPDVKFRQTGNSYTIDLYSSYKTDNPDEEALCPF